jgi:hypothetical protein
MGSLGFELDGDVLPEGSQEAMPSLPSAALPGPPDATTAQRLQPPGGALSRPAFREDGGEGQGGPLGAESRGDEHSDVDRRRPIPTDLT